MNFSLASEKSFHQNCHRIFSELQSETCELLRGDGNKDEIVHNSRKNFKKLRAVMRLVRPVTGDDEYKDYNRFYRDCSRTLAPVRDSYVLVETLDMAAEVEEGDLPEEGVAGFRELLFSKYENTRRALLEVKDSIAEVAAALEAKPVVALPVLNRDEESGAIADGVEKVYRQGRERMEAAYKERTPEAFHEWRKSVKYLWHLVEIFTPLWPNVLAEYAESIHDLSDLLGDDHDYAVLMAEARETESVKNDFDFFKKLNGLIQRERIRLENEAEILGAKIYYELPQDFADRLVFFYQLFRR